jgi:hypothetical protein
MSQIYMLLVKNIIVDIIIINSIWGLLDNSTHKYLFVYGTSLYLIKKYI